MCVCVYGVVCVCGVWCVCSDRCVWCMMCVCGGVCCMVCVCMVWCVWCVMCVCVWCSNSLSVLSCLERAAGYRCMMARWSILEVRDLGGGDFEELWQWRGWWFFPQPYAPTAPWPACSWRWAPIIFRHRYVVHVPAYRLGGG